MLVLAACLLGLEYLLPSVGWGWGQAHCWVLKDQPRALGGRRLFEMVVVGGVVGVSGPPFAPCSLCASVCVLVVGGGCWWGCCLRSA